MKNLKDFMNEYKIRLLFRQFMKVSYKIKEIEARNDYIEEIKNEFHKNNKIENLEYLLATGKKQLKQFQTIIEMQK